MMMMNMIITMIMIMLPRSAHVRQRHAVLPERRAPGQAPPGAICIYIYIYSFKSETLILRVFGPQGVYIYIYIYIHIYIYIEREREIDR